MELGHLSPLEMTIRDFASRHNLHIEPRPAGDGLAIRLMFAHPAGGQASLDLLPHSPGKFALESIWWEDDLNIHARRIHRRELGLMSCAAQTARIALIKELSAILSLTRDDLIKGSVSYSGILGAYSGMVNAMTPKLPFPTMDPSDPQP